MRVAGVSRQGLQLRVRRRDMQRHAEAGTAAEAAAAGKGMLTGRYRKN